MGRTVGFAALTEVTMQSFISGSKLATFFSLVYFLANSPTVKMGALYSCETTTDFNWTDFMTIGAIDL
jgi:hypothetical protein